MAPKPVLYLPKYSYLGDYQILLGYRSNMEFRTHWPQSFPSPSEAPDILFMCCSAETLGELCELFPQTRENLKARAL
jgi:hypothetical protein